MGIHWYFRFAVKTADNRDQLLKDKALKQTLQGYYKGCMLLDNFVVEE